MLPILPYVFVIGAIGGTIAIVYLGYTILRLGRENRQLAERLVEVDRMKRNFMSHVSHELKAPLASIQETTHLLLERIPGPLTEKQARLLELTLQSGHRLAQMIGNILDLSRLEAGIVEYEMQTFNIAELVHNVVIDFTSAARAKSLTLLEHRSEPLYVECDPNRMVQLFKHLFDNAIRFSAKGGVVSVRVQSTPQHAIIAIADSGPGIEDDRKDKVFQRFHQVKQGKKSHGESLGLGLAISRALVQAHGGRIWVDDNPAGGSIFSVELPRSANELAA